MKKILLLTLVALFQFAINGSAQLNHKLELEIGAIGTTHYLAKPSPKPLSSIGFNYLRYVFPKTYITLGLQGNTRNFSESSTDSTDMFTGSLKFNQWTGSIGVRHLFREEIIETFNYFVQAGFHYTKVNAQGVYNGGRFGSAYYGYKRFRGVGFDFKVGAVYQFLSPWYIGANVGVYVTGGKLGIAEDFTILPDEEPEIEKLNINESLNRVQFEIRVGKRF